VVQVKTIPLVIYVALMVWCMLPEHERKHGYMYWIQQRIKFHRAEAEYHGRRVIDLELQYKEQGA
jgi:hypothetical protein